ncbi:MAG TPA: hypothetical protein EYP98_05070, partial [Planctomycetes bacterium]|nr:hypothetical protein [Planctomycetota bacterium]
MFRLSHREFEADFAGKIVAQIVPARFDHKRVGCGWAKFASIPTIVDFQKLGSQLFRSGGVCIRNSIAGFIEINVQIV